MVLGLVTSFSVYPVLETGLGVPVKVEIYGAKREPDLQFRSIRDLGQLWFRHHTGSFRHSLDQFHGFQEQFYPKGPLLSTLLLSAASQSLA